MTFASITPYLFFSGRCEEAIAFYRVALGAEVEMLMYHKDSPDSPPPGMLAPGFENKVMHTTLRIGDAIIMASDGCDGNSRFDGFRISLALETEADAQRVFAALSDGGEVLLPIAKTFWSPCFGMVTDKFGVPWMITVNTPSV